MTLGFDAAEAIIELGELAEEHIFYAAEVGFLYFPLLPVYFPHVAEPGIDVAEAIIHLAAHFSHPRVHIHAQIADTVVINEHTDEYNDHRHSRPDRH